MALNAFAIINEAMIDDICKNIKSMITNQYVGCTYEHVKNDIGVITTLYNVITTTRPILPMETIKKSPTTLYRAGVSHDQGKRGSQRNFIVRSWRDGAVTIHWNRPTNMIFSEKMGKSVDGMLAAVKEQLMIHPDKIFSQPDPPKIQPDHHSVRSFANGESRIVAFVDCKYKMEIAEDLREQDNFFYVGYRDVDNK